MNSTQQFHHNQGDIDNLIFKDALNDKELEISDSKTRRIIENEDAFVDENQMRKRYAFTNEATSCKDSHDPMVAIDQLDELLDLSTLGNSFSEISETEFRASDSETTTEIIPDQNLQAGSGSKRHTRDVRKGLQKMTEQNSKSPGWKACIDPTIPRSIIKKYILKRLREVPADLRIDNMKTKLVRIVYKTPQILAAKKLIVRTALHKSQKYDEYVISYKASYNYIFDILEENNIAIGDRSESRLFFDFCSLHFPWEKVRAVGSKMGVPVAIQDKLDQDQLRSKTSQKHFREMASTNRMFLPLLDLAILYAKDNEDDFSTAFKTLNVLRKNLNHASESA